MSGVGQKNSRRIPDGDIVCLLSCAHPPGQPLRLWVCDRVLSEVQTETDEEYLSFVRNLLHFIDSKERKG